MLSSVYWMFFYAECNTFIIRLSVSILGIFMLNIILLSVCRMSLWVCLKFLCTVSVYWKFSMLSFITLKFFYTECHIIYCYAECHSTSWRYAECHIFINMLSVLCLLICWVSLWWTYFMLSCSYYYADYRYAKCQYAECRSAECRGTCCCHCCCWKRRGLNRSIII